MNQRWKTERLYPDLNLRKLILIRHSETTGQGVFLGKEDPPLSEQGKDLLRHFQVDYSKETDFYCSPLLRTRETFDVLFPGVTPQYDGRIQEIDFGLFGGLAFSQIHNSYPEEVTKWSEDLLGFTFPEGEAVQTFIARIENFVESLLKKPHSSIVVSHGGVIRFMICRLLGIDYRRHLAFQIDRPSVNVIDLRDNIGTLAGLNLKEFSFMHS